MACSIDSLHEDIVILKRIEFEALQVGRTRSASIQGRYFPRVCRFPACSIMPFLVFSLRPQSPEDGGRIESIHEDVMCSLVIPDEVAHSGENGPDSFPHESSPHEAKAPSDRSV